MNIDFKKLGKVRPTVEGDWNKNKSYRELSIVFDEESNKSYISKKPVPSGISILNKNYWYRFGNNRIDSDSILILSRKDDTGYINSFTLKEAIDSISIEDRRLGLFISFYEKPIDSNGIYRWNLYQFNSNSVNNFSDISAWDSIYYNRTKFYGLLENEDILYKVKKNPSVGDYVFVGTSLGEAVVYRCYTKNIWKETTEKATEYLTILIQGTVTVGSNGNWFNNGVDTGISAKGEKGDKPYLRYNETTGYIEYSFDLFNWVNLINKEEITGSSATIEIGNVTTLPAGSQVNVTNSGTSNSAIFNFGIPKGDKGDKGDQGNSGVTGDTSDIIVINDLNGGESEEGNIKVLAAEQGKVLNEKIKEINDNLEDVINESINNPKYIKVYVDNKNKFLFGIKDDGSIEWAKGVPSPIKDYIANKLKENLFEYQECKKNKLLNYAIVDLNEKIIEYYPKKNNIEKNNLFKTIIPTRINTNEAFTCSPFIDDDYYVYNGHTDKISKYLAKEYKRIEKKGELEINKTGTSQYVRSIVGRGNNIFVSLRGNGFGYWIDDTKKAEFRALWDDKDVMSGVFTNYSHSETSSITYVDNIDSPGRGMGSCKLSGIGDCYICADKDITKGDITLFLKYSGVSDCYFPILKYDNDNILGLIISEGKLGIKVNNQDYISSNYTLSDNWINIKISINISNVDLFVRTKECQNGAWSKISTANITMNSGNKIGIGVSSSENIIAYVDDIEYNPTDIEIASYNAGRIVIINKNDMSIVKAYDINIRAHGMIIDGDILYVALNGGMNIYRISSDNNSLTLLYTFRYSDLHYSNKLWATEMQNLAVFNVSNKKYVAATCYTHGLTIIDVTDPLSVTQVIRYDDILKIWGSGGLYHEWDIYVQYPYIFTTIGASHVVVNQGASIPAGEKIITGIKIRDISDIMEPIIKLITVPEVINPYPISKDPLPISLVKIGQYLFLGYGDKGIAVFEINDMNTIYKYNLLPNYQSNTTFLSKKNGYLYIADSAKIFEDYTINLSTFKI